MDRARLGLNPRWSWMILAVVFVCGVLLAAAAAHADVYSVRWTPAGNGGQFYVGDNSDVFIFQEWGNGEVWTSVWSDGGEMSFSYPVPAGTFAASMAAELPGLAAVAATMGDPGRDAAMLAYLLSSWPEGGELFGEARLPIDTRASGVAAGTMDWSGTPIGGGEEPPVPEVTAAVPFSMSLLLLLSGRRWSVRRRGEPHKGRLLPSLSSPASWPGGPSVRL